MLDAVDRISHDGAGELRATLSQLTQQAGVEVKGIRVLGSSVRRTFRGCSWGADRSA